MHNVKENVSSHWHTPILHISKMQGRCAHIRLFKHPYPYADSVIIIL